MIEWTEKPIADNPMSICELQQASNAEIHNTFYSKCAEYFRLLEEDADNYVVDMKRRDLFYELQEDDRFALANICWRAGLPIDLTEDDVVELLARTKDEQNEPKN